MKVYLAARYSRREELLEYADVLRQAGIAVTSRWLKGGHQISEQQLLDDRALGERFASEDWDDLERADVMIAFSEPPRSAPNRGGRHVELGIALALGMTVYIVGPTENVFYSLADRRFDTWGECLATMKTEREEVISMAERYMQQPNQHEGAQRVQASPRGHVHRWRLGRPSGDEVTGGSVTTGSCRCGEQREFREDVHPTGWT